MGLQGSFVHILTTLSPQSCLRSLETTREASCCVTPVILAPSGLSAFLLQTAPLARSITVAHILHAAPTLPIASAWQQLLKSEFKNKSYHRTVQQTSERKRSRHKLRNSALRHLGSFSTERCTTKKEGLDVMQAGKTRRGRVPNNSKLDHNKQSPRSPYARTIYMYVSVHMCIYLCHI